MKIWEISLAMRNITEEDRSIGDRAATGHKSNGRDAPRLFQAVTQSRGVTTVLLG